MKHIFKDDVGRSGEFAGYDGKTYWARIKSYRKGIARIVYNVRNLDGSLSEVDAYLPRRDHSRMSMIFD